MGTDRWISLRLDTETGIETIRAHFTGHAYDPHWHDSYLVGFTEQGVQQFHCRRQLHSSTPGQAFLLEPGEIHDGHAPAPGGFTYSTLYLQPHWLRGQMQALFEDAPDDCLPGFAHTLAEEPQLVRHIAEAFNALHGQDLRIVRHAALDRLLEALSAALHWRRVEQRSPHLPAVAMRAREYLHAHVEQDIGLNDLAAATGTDRFRLSRAFKAAYGLAPHAYLVQLRLSLARRLLRQGSTPADVAAALGFADQSHLGRWFRRAYGLSPAGYCRHCTNLPDR
ncbi:AraC family transcriptional regulator [Pseudomonas sp. DTU_2021_1001937_2_SI_NGA_ILE_001]|uniref:AraC family transcriptional regulator n=1 Tax=Pseudomonas sp. DTU_2021_1001937_2_SI_NGA_ILE_001 TaxID=3077589 RepID=UPI0025E3DFC0|nr:AraC family transcriptional regulator [Pseudomonas sp. DTU_2021_1001937_2_SI_NGA_ILE_001]WNW11927.1 AraC family transcriptional regulator [Pseudomonas sp. DTU_2021_1001937_2_SI_NGA_ILE_001]